MKHALILGGKGFVGWYLNNLLQKKYKVTCVGKDYDITNEVRINSLMEHTKPDFVINLAFVTTVQETFDDPKKTYDVGFYGTLNILNALKKTGFRGKLLNISSSEIYGDPDCESFPLTEQTPVNPTNPYSLTKSAVESLCHQWHVNEKIDIIIVRPFTHIGPGQSDRFAFSNFSKQLAEIKLGKREKVLKVQNLYGTRDITDVRDVVRAYYLLLENGKAGEVYNVCSGKEKSLQNLLEELIKVSGLDIKLKKIDSPYPINSSRRFLGSYDKIYNSVKWKPQIELKTTFTDMIKDWENLLNT